jgi:hypothetical protein
MNWHRESAWWSLPEALRVVGRVEKVELKAILNEQLESALAVLDTEVNPPRMRCIHYLDTPDLALHRHGVIVRARVSSRSCGDGSDKDVGEDMVVKLRGPARPVPANLRGLDVELDALPVETAWAASMKRRLKSGRVERALERRRPARHLLGKKQRRLLKFLTSNEIDLDDLMIFGPVEVVRLTSGSPGDRVGVERWMLPDGSRIIELFAKCRPTRSRAMAARVRDLISDQRVTLADHQATKTQILLERMATTHRDVGT